MLGSSSLMTNLRFSFMRVLLPRAPWDAQEGSRETILLIPVGSLIALGISEGDLGTLHAQTWDRITLFVPLLAPPNTSEFYLLHNCLYSSKCICSPTLESLNSWLQPNYFPRFPMTKLRFKEKPRSHSGLREGNGLVSNLVYVCLCSEVSETLWSP